MADINVIMSIFNLLILLFLLETFVFVALFVSLNYFVFAFNLSSSQIQPHNVFIYYLRVLFTSSICVLKILTRSDSVDANLRSPIVYHDPSRRWDFWVYIDNRRTLYLSVGRMPENNRRAKLRINFGGAFVTSRKCKTEYVGGGVLLEMEWRGRGRKRQREIKWRGRGKKRQREIKC
ncbi:hypothetical protein RND81_01G064900 [Saponaria officinalis]|uniref:Uncharacterized protein n=1 Tax=Saponaria officinalis TaxID=3572 RepID=A0AAW1NCY0_SAPOF